MTSSTSLNVVPTLANEPAKLRKKVTMESCPADLDYHC